jgi:two-component system nitrate/nitrite response regulator NarL
VQGHVRVALADDDPRVRSALVDVLEDDGRFVVVGDVSSGDEIVRLAEDQGPDVVLVDVGMPGGGVEAVSRLRALARPPVVVVVSADVARDTVVAHLRAGAQGYLAKGATGGHLAEMVHRVAAGEVHVAVPHGAHVLSALQRPPS